MRPTHYLVAGILALSIAPALAQTTSPTSIAPPANKDAPANPAVSTNATNNPGAPAAGANSFTEGQAKARLEKDGYTSVTALTKDPNGVWRGKATKGGQPVDVAVDYQGNIVPR